MIGVGMFDYHTVFEQMLVSVGSLVVVQRKHHRDKDPQYVSVYAFANDHLGCEYFLMQLKQPNILIVYIIQYKKSLLKVAVSAC